MPFLLIIKITRKVLFLHLFCSLKKHHQYSLNRKHSTVYVLAGLPEREALLTGLGTLSVREADAESTRSADSDGPAGSVCVYHRLMHITIIILNWRSDEECGEVNERRCLGMRRFSRGVLGCSRRLYHNVWYYDVTLQCAKPALLSKIRPSTRQGCIWAAYNLSHTELLPNWLLKSNSYI